MDRFRLYCGLVRNEKWYNYTQTEEIKGGVLAVLDGKDKSGTARLFNLVKGSIKSLYTESGDEYILKDKDYEDLYFEDCWKIGLEATKLFTDEDNPKMIEYFRCRICSSNGNQVFVKREDSWFDLIRDGHVDELFLDDPQRVEFDTVFPVGLNVQGMTYNEVTREYLTIGQMLKIANMPLETEVDLINAIWDAQIKKIKNMSERDLTVFVKRNPKDSFCKKYLTSQKDIEAMSNSIPEIGLNAKYRSVNCDQCHNEIGGYLDFTNFFDFLSPRRSDQNITGMRF